MWQLRARLEDLQYRYSEAAAVVSKMQTLEQENRELRQMLENTDRSYSQVVISAPVISFAQTLVAAGSDRGIQSGSAVLHQGTLLGLIDRVEEKQSSVILLAQLRERAILVRTSQDVQGLLRGNGREILLTEIPSDAPLHEGDLVFTEAAPGVKAGLLVGRVVKVNRDNQAQATQTAVVEQLVNFFEVALVEVQ
jgi:cell shape-determining protein MreC